jgi:hypothetical protein
MDLYPLGWYFIIFFDIISSGNISMYKWEYSNNIELKELGFQRMEWIHLTQDTDQWLDIVNAII